MTTKTNTNIINSNLILYYINIIQVMKQKGKCQKNNIGNKKVNKKESKYKNIMI